MRYTFDTKDFDKKFAKLMDKTVPELQERGMGRAMTQLLNDCMMEIPTVPVDEGTLRGSGSIFVQNQLVATSEGSPKSKKGTPNKDHREKVLSHQLVGVVGFNTPYASVLHEGINVKQGYVIRNYSEPSSGKKFLEKKLLSNGKSYLGEIADTIKEASK